MIFSFLRTQIRQFAKKCPEPPKGCPPPRKPQPKFTKCLKGPSGVHPIKDGGYKLYRNITFFVCFPLIFGVAFITFSNTEERERPEFHKYEYMRIRSKTFPWGSDRSLFHNPHLNALPDGYED